MLNILLELMIGDNVPKCYVDLLQEASTYSLNHQDGGVVTAVIVACCAIGGLFAVLYAWHVSKITLDTDSEYEKPLILDDTAGNQQDGPKSVVERVKLISEAISEGAGAFLSRMYSYMAVFMVGFSIIIIVAIGAKKYKKQTGENTYENQSMWVNAIFTAIAFNVGCITSILSGYIGMKIAVYANSRTALEAQRGYGPAFIIAFKAGAVMGFALVAMGVMMCYILVNIFRQHYGQLGSDYAAGNYYNGSADIMYEAVAGYGLGGSSIALFGRVGGGIYTKAADVGADLCGKLEFDIPEDDPRNPAVIADNVGDNVGDVAGMGADLFGSFAESTCAAMVITAQADFLGKWSYLCFPMLIPATGMMVCLLTSFVATNFMVVQDKDGIEPSLKRQLLVSTVLMTPVIYGLCVAFLPKTIPAISGKFCVKNWHIFFCIASGLWSGLIIGYITEYYTSNTYGPVQEVSDSCRTGAATNIIYGLALGYKSVIIPIFCLAGTVFLSLKLAGMYGIAMAALGILSTMSIGLTIDAYGPICDNAGGIAEMSGMGEDIRTRTDALDAAGNTTAAIGKGFAIGSAALVSLALFGGFVTVRRKATGGHQLATVDILESYEFAGLLVGAMIPYWFSAMTMKAVGVAALAMVEEVRRQFSEKPAILQGTEDPDYALCVDISTRASLEKMLGPGALVMLTPLITGYLFGPEALAGVLAGALVSGVQMAISASNTGGAWDNAKKYIEEGNHGGKGSDPHKAAVVGDTVGDPLKDTSGPSLNIVMKLMAIISLVFARSFPETGYLIQLFQK